VIRFEKVTKTYPGTSKPALDAVSIDIEKGEFVFLVGQSGSGKSTALRLVLREARSTAGRVHVAGKDLNRLAGWKVPRLRRQIGTVFQDFRLLPNKTVTENIAFAQQVIGKSRAEIAESVPQTLKLVGLEARETVSPTSCPAASSSGSRSPGRTSTSR
jgi:cell division transport system ATP-binding protein